jgi:DNA repair exonuclease SbcCD ATPase subunit
MSVLTKVSRYRSGEVRFGRRQYVFDNTVTTYQLTPEQLERYRNGEKLEDILKEVTTMNKPKVIAYAKYEEVLAERDELKKQLEELKANAAVNGSNEEIERLKREVIHAHQLVTEKEEEISRLQEMFNEAMMAKEQLQKEIIFLENQVQRLKEANQELTERNDRYVSDLSRLEQEVKGFVFMRSRSYTAMFTGLHKVRMESLGSPGGSIPKLETQE